MPGPVSDHSAFVGVDIGRAFLDFAACGRTVRVPNAPEGFAEMLKVIGRRRVHIVCEASAHGDALIRYLHARRRKVSVVSPYRVRQFAKASGKFAKTDKIDAVVIAQFGRALRPPLMPKRDRQVRRLRDLLRRRTFLVRLSASLKIQACACANLRELRESTSRLRKTVDEEIISMDAASDGIIDRFPEFSRKCAALKEVVGVGHLTSKIVLGEFPEIGAVGKNQAAALAGLAPFNWDSGQMSGSKHIRGGRAHLRRALYMAAFIASRRNPILANYYKRLRARGKPFRVALTAVMRKLIVALNARIRRLNEQRQVSSSFPKS